MKPPSRPTPLALLLVLAALLGGCRAAAADPAPRWQEGQESVEEDDFSDFEEFDEFGEFEESVVAPDEEVFDPLSGYNRAMFWFNDKVFLYALNPLAKGYRWAVPQGARIALGRAFRNALVGPRFVGSLMQAKIGRAGTELGRFLVNTTIGIGGLFDPADAWFGWRAPSPEDFGQTLGAWGVGEGFPIVLPFLGPSNLRDGLATIPDGFLDPVYYVDSAALSVGISVYRVVNYTSLHIGEYESLKQDALDPYTLFRDAYRQNREQLIEE